MSAADVPGQAFTERLWAQLKPGVSFTEAIRGAMAPESRILEIGPGAAPVFRRRDFPRLKVSDCCDTTELRRQLQSAYKLETLPPDLFDDIDYVCADSRLAECVPAGERFELIFSSHNVEHQPDLLAHLRSLQALLDEDGAVALVVPHKQRTFDVFRSPTTTSDVLMTHYGPPGWKATQLAFDADSRSAIAPPGSTHLFGASDPMALGDLGQAFERLQARLRGEATDLAYLHHHVFTPASMQVLLIELYLLRQCDLLPCLCSGAVSNSFMIVLQEVPWPGDPAQAAVLRTRLEELRMEHYRKMAFQGG